VSAKKRSKRNETGRSSWLTAACLLALGAYTALSLAGPPEGVANPGGPVGAALVRGLTMAFGAFWAWVVPLLLAGMGLGLLTGRLRWLTPLSLRLAVLWLVSVSWAGLPDGPLEWSETARWAGWPGITIGRGCADLVGVWGGRIFLSLALLITVVLILWRWLRPPLAAVGRVLRAIGRPFAALAGLLRSHARPDDARPSRVRIPKSAALMQEDDEDDEISAAPPSRERRLHLTKDKAPRLAAVAATADDDDQELDMAPAFAPAGPVTLPDLDLLRDPDDATPSLSPTELDTEADLLEDTLRSFGVEGEVKDVRPGPVVTTFEYQPASGIRVNQIVQRADDLALAMKARSMRMEAPIPGKAAVGIEIPNRTAQIVRLKDVLQATRTLPRRPLTVVLGKDVEGQPVSIDLAAQPHLLVAGSTGSGKSVCLNAMITNLLLYNDPSLLRLLLIDPKMLELSVYNGVPHLLLPVVTDPKEALRALKWMTAQMDARYRQLAKFSVRNIEQYNTKVARGEIKDAEGAPVTAPMPYYLTIVDELADLMMQLGQEFEIPVTRLAQKARAVGLHLILATQRPSVDVLTGVIKANIPCRIAFRVIQKNDSRTILDMNGAEQLLGKGDMLYLQPGRALPMRVHGALVEVEECEAVAAHWREYADVAEEISLTAGGSDGSAGIHTGDDDLFDQAVRVVVTHQSGSTSLLQRRLRIGYTRAGRLMDMMEEAGIVGPFTGSKARDVLVKPGDLPDLFETPAGVDDDEDL
jgi:S-DNA-T family DNA segregation ATPase FtsK/SpoIIIE